ncbi:protein kinase [Polyangium sp. 15x6]|uniref:protein kinase domain-containing protein n=1 Tax=Polyangium sp. 15x6 TaxID=3042687 RepID=UPI00249C0143|nr:protein kinase [Polyangium sp. 15x6]MDI3290792.1 protein kinase [Polyangium sp. 15x6]
MKGDTERNEVLRGEDVPTKVELPRSVRPSAPPPASTSLAGATIAGRYRLERQLGVGGMGEVFLARDAWKNTRVALKILHRRMADNLTVVNRFRREARIMRELSSPHAAVIHDFGQTDDGALYLVMEYLEGETLGGLLEREAPLASARVTRIALDLLDVLADAHRRGVVHRDIKPQNVFLARAPGKDGEPVVKLLDFGIAKLEDHESTELTETGAIWGTPRYMSPEQARGQPIDRRSDLYSLGAMMYRALTGEPPFEGASVAELSYALTHKAPVSPEKRRPDLDIPIDLGRIVMRALEKDPNARYSTAAEMADDLRALQSEPAPAPAATSGRATALAMRSWVLATLLFTLVALAEFPRVARSTFPGFTVEAGLLVSAVVEPTWPGIQRGIEPYDALLAVDGIPVRRGRDVHEYVHRLAPGTLVDYTLRRGDRTFDVEVPVTPFGWASLLKIYSSGLLAAILFLLVGGVAGWKRPTLRPVQALVAFTSAVGLFLIASVDFDLVDSAFSWLYYLGCSATGAAEVHLALAFSGLFGATRKRPWLIWLPYLPALALLVTWRTAGADPAIGNACTRAGIGMMLLGLLALLGSFLYMRLRGRTLSARQSARFMLWAAGLSVLPTIALQLLPISLGLQTASVASLSWLAMLPVAGFPAAFAHQIQRRQMFDVDVALREISRVLAMVVVLGAVFAAAAFAFGGLAYAIAGPEGMYLGLGAVAGVTAVVAASEPVALRLRRLVERRADVDAATVLDEMAGAVANAASEDEVVTLLVDTIRRCFSPRTTRLLERGDGGIYWARVPGAPPSQSMAGPRSGTGPRSLTGPRADTEGDFSGATREPANGTPADEIRRRLTRLGHFDAHAFLVLPLDAAEGAAGAAAAPASVVVVGARSDGKAYSSYDAALVAGLLRIAALRLHALGERADAERRLLLERCFGPDRGEAGAPGAELVGGVPARGLATALVLRFSGLDTAADRLPPRRFKVLVDELSEAAATAAFTMAGTMHASRGDEMLFAFGALGEDRSAVELASLRAALHQIEQTAEIAARHGAPFVRARVGVARGLLTVGTFGASFHSHCMILGAAVQEATELASAARDGEVLVDEAVARAAEGAEAMTIDPLPAHRGTRASRVSRREG